MLLKEEINNLEKYDGTAENQKVFSIYLNTHPDQGTKWKIELKNALKDLAYRTKHSDDHEEKTKLKKSLKKLKQKFKV